MNAIVGVAPGPSRRRRLAIGFIGAVVTALTLFVTSAPTAQAAPPPPATFAVSGLTSAAAGTAQTVKVTSLLNGKPNANYRGTVVLTSTDAQAVLPTPYTFTAEGQGCPLLSGDTEDERIAERDRHRLLSPPRSRDCRR